MLVSQGPDLNVSTASQYTTSGAPFILDKVQEGTIYSFAVMLETSNGYRSQISEVRSVEMPLGKYEILYMFLLLKVKIKYLTSALFSLFSSVGADDSRV